MPNTQFHTAISAPRFQRYLQACGNIDRALALYRANITLSKQLYGVVGVFEILLRNSIDRYMILEQGYEWLETAVVPGGYFDVNEGCQDTYHSIQEAIHKLGILYTHDGLISKLSLGFWTYLFSSKAYGIAHYESICFAKDIISTNRTERRYSLILELLGWLGYNSRQILFGIDGVARAHATIVKIANELEDVSRRA